MYICKYSLAERLEDLMDISSSFQRFIERKVAKTSTDFSVPMNKQETTIFPSSQEDSQCVIAEDWGPEVVEKYDHFMAVIKDYLEYSRAGFFMICI